MSDRHAESLSRGLPPTSCGKMWLYSFTHSAHICRGQICAGCLGFISKQNRQRQVSSRGFHSKERMGTDADSPPSPKVLPAKMSTGSRGAGNSRPPSAEGFWVVSCFSPTAGGKFLLSSLLNYKLRSAHAQGGVFLVKGESCVPAHTS